MDECQFYDKKRLEQLHRQEEQLFAEAKEKGDIPNDLTNYEVRALSLSLSVSLTALNEEQYVLYLVRCGVFFLV